MKVYMHLKMSLLSDICTAAHITMTSLNGLSGSSPLSKNTVKEPEPLTLALARDTV